VAASSVLPIRRIVSLRTDPVTSAKTTVTTLRTSVEVARGSPSRVAQFWQNRARSEFSRRR
jgi:hypothetical protein